MSYLNQYRDTGNFMEALLRGNERYSPIVKFLDHAIKNLEELSWEECELIGLQLGLQNGSAFCGGIREGVLSALGADPAAVRSRKFEAALSYASKLNHDSAQIRETDVEELRSVGWNDHGIEDLNCLVSILKIYSMLANAMGFGYLPEEVFREMGDATVKMDGYDALFRSFLERTS